MKHKGKPANRLVTQNENGTYIKLTKGNRYSFVNTLDGNCSDSSSKVSVKYNADTKSQFSNI